MEQDKPNPTEASFSGASFAKELIEGMPDHLKTSSEQPQLRQGKEFLNQPKQHGMAFEAEMPVSVVRTSGAVEYDWKVGAFDEEGKPLNPIGEDGSITVYHTEPDGRHAEKTVGFEKLVSWQPKFAEGQHVVVQSESIGADGWQVYNQLPNGEVQVVKSAAEGKMWRKFLPAVELLAMQQPSYELTEAEKADTDVNGHRQRVTIVRGAQDKPAEQPKRGLGRLFRRG